MALLVLKVWRFMFFGVDGGGRGNGWSVIDNVKADGGHQGDAKNPNRWPNCSLFMCSRQLGPLSPTWYDGSL